MYDFHDIISDEVEDQTNHLLGGSLVGLNFVPVQQQSNGSDCGVFAIAFATCLVLESDPRQVTFDVNGIRHRLASCLRDRAISMFPCLRFFEALNWPFKTVNSLLYWYIKNKSV